MPATLTRTAPPPPLQLPVEIDEGAARRALRGQLSALERRLAAAGEPLPAPHPRRGAPRLLDLAALERARRPLLARARGGALGGRARGRTRRRAGAPGGDARRPRGPPLGARDPRPARRARLRRLARQAPRPACSACSPAGGRSSSPRAVRYVVVRPPTFTGFWRPRTTARQRPRHSPGIALLCRSPASLPAGRRASPEARQRGRANHYPRDSAGQFARGSGSGVRISSICSRRSSRNGGRITLLPSSSSGTSTVKPGRRRRRSRTTRRWARGSRSSGSNGGR